MCLNDRISPELKLRKIIPRICSLLSAALIQSALALHFILAFKKLKCEIYVLCACIHFLLFASGKSFRNLRYIPDKQLRSLSVFPAYSDSMKLQSHFFIIIIIIKVYNTISGARSIEQLV